VVAAAEERNQVAQEGTEALILRLRLRHRLQMAVLLTINQRRIKRRRKRRLSPIAMMNLHLSVPNQRVREKRRFAVLELPVVVEAVAAEMGLRPLLHHHRHHLPLARIQIISSAGESQLRLTNCSN
jgi:hypothetical protein